MTSGARRSRETPAIVLFDIDGTLVLTGGAGTRAMDRAFHDLFSIAQAFHGVAMPGRTDTVILAEALGRTGVRADDPRLAGFRARYVLRLGEELERPHPDKRIMPGVRELLDALRQRDDVRVGLLTGNFTEAAHAKLSHFDLWRYFECGAYGEDAGDRNALVPVALDRIRARGFPGVSARDAFVVGDTPHDVACAAAAGATSVAVATGFFDRAALRAARADVIFDDLRDTRAFLALLD